MPRRPQPARSIPPPAVAAPPAPQRSLAAVLVLSLLGLAVALTLARIHGSAHAGGSPSFCAIAPGFDCDKVAASPYSVVFGVPVAVWGVLAYGVMAVLAASGLRARRPHAAWPAGILLLLAAIAVLAAVTLALVSLILIRSLCLLCAITWIVDAAILVAAWRATRAAGGPAGAVADDAEVLARRPVPTAAAALLAAGVAAGLIAFYDRPRATPAPAATAAGTAVGVPSAAPGVIVEFSDYECPFCARAHEEVKALLAARPDLKLVHRNFPLDDKCNRAIPRPFHKEACELARASICAEVQGKLGPMGDALFHNQQVHAPLDELATQVGLDLPQFKACLDAPSTKGRLAEDIELGIAAGVRATPTFEVNGRLYTGQIPPEAIGSAQR